MINRAIILGNLGKDPVQHFTKTSKVYYRFTVATNKRWKDKDGQKQEKVSRHKVTERIRKFFNP